MKLRSTLFEIVLISIAVLITQKAISDTQNDDSQAASNNKIIVNVIVADSYQPPITFNDGSGMSQDIVDALNGIQTKYYFKHIPIPPQRIDEWIEVDKLHVASLYNIDWGFLGKDFTRTKTLLSSGDVYISLKGELDNFENKKYLSKAVVQGFHYSFIDFNQEMDIQIKEHSLVFVRSEKAVIEMVLSERTKLGIVSTVTLDYLKIVDPKAYEQLNVSSIYDTKYDRYFVVSNSGPVTSEEMDSLINKLLMIGVLKNIYQKYGLTLPESLNKTE